MAVCFTSNEGRYICGHWASFAGISKLDIYNQCAFEVRISGFAILRTNRFANEFYLLNALSYSDKSGLVTYNTSLIIRALFSNILTSRLRSFHDDAVNCVLSFKY